MPNHAYFLGQEPYKEPQATVQIASQASKYVI